MAPPVKPAESVSIPLSRLPRDVEAATALLKSLEYKKARAWRVEADCILASDSTGAFTVYFNFNDRDGEVGIIRAAGWPEVTVPE